MLRAVAIPLAFVVALPLAARAGAFIFASEANGTDIITHPTGYTGSGGVATVTVCIDPTSANAAEMVVPLQNIADTWSALGATTPNLFSGADNDIPSGSIDFESVALHEVGHCLGLAHPNLGSESGVPSADRNYTRTTDGLNGEYDLGSGVDGMRGSSDDARGDDVNLHWFRLADNDPFVVGPVVDTTTYGLLGAQLPAGHTSAANADRSVASLMGSPYTEAVMQQGSFFDEDQRALAGDDVAMIRLAMSGLDETQGTSDDYTLDVVYVGLTKACDVVLDFDDSKTGFAVCQVSGTFLSSNHLRITSVSIYFNTGFSWYFNQTASSPTTTSTSSTSTSTSTTATSSTSTTTSTSVSTSSSSSTSSTTSATTASTSTTSTTVIGTTTTTSSTTSTWASSTTTSTFSSTSTSASSTTTTSTTFSTSTTPAPTSTSTTTSTVTSTSTTTPTLPLAGCEALPRTGCIRPERGLVLVKESTPGREKMKILFKRLVAPTSLASFGDPAGGSTAYDVCIYDDVDQLVAEMRIDRAGDACAPRSRPCWKQASRSELKYRDVGLEADGVKRMLMRSGNAGRGRIVVQAKNDAPRGRLAMPTGITAALSGAARATVQVSASNGGCFELAATDVRVAGTAVFRAVAE